MLDSQSEAMQYVQHRIDEIHKLTSSESWRHCPGHLNPADLPSRGVQSHQLIYSSLWWNGPQFLQQSLGEWPVVNPNSIENDQQAMNETVKFPVPTTHIFLNTRGVSSNVIQHVDKVLTCEKFSNLCHLLRVTAYILRFINNLKNKIRSTSQKSDKRRKERNRPHSRSPRARE